MAGPKIIRLIDANANRAREGLRVVEEVARMLWDDAGLSQKIKEQRHTVTRLVTALPVTDDELLAARDSAEDVGQETRLAAEKERKDVAALLAANLKRVQEAVRVLEEFTKLLDAQVAEGFKQLRFTLYIMEKEILSRITSKGK